MDIEEKIRDLRAQIERHERLYRVENNPEISDEAFDRLMIELRNLEAENPLFANLASPTQRVGDDRLRGFQTRQHLVRMLSLDNTYNVDDLRAFDRRLAEFFEKEKLPYLVEPKLDGLAISLVYENGVFQRAVTRGNGEEGDDVTRNVRILELVPEALSGKDWPSLIEFRGEVFMTHTEFERINKQRRTNGQSEYMNPRNLASGTIKLLDGSLLKLRKLELMLYGTGACDGFNFDKQSDLKSCFENWGLPTLQRSTVLHGIDAVWKEIQDLDEWRKTLNYPTDGAVIKLNNRDWQTKVGSTSKAPRWAISYKFSAEKAETQIRKITIQLGRTGALTPVAELEPVEVAGTIVSRATLHNEDEIARKDIREGDVVIVEKAGEIIPAVVKVILDRRPAGLVSFNFQERLKELGYAAYRPEGQSAWRLREGGGKEQLKRKLIHFAGRTAMDIDGLGKEVVRQLVDSERVRSISDLYELKREDLLNLEKFGEKSSDNLLEALDKSKENDLWRLIHGLGIPHVGAEAAKDLSRNFESLTELKMASSERLQNIDGIGEKMAHSLTDWFQSETHSNELRLLEERQLNFKSSMSSDSEQEGSLKGKQFVLTGTLSELTRDEAKQLIEDAGGKVVGSVSSRTSYVLAGEKAGSKLGKAEKLGIPVLNKEAFLSLLKGDQDP